MKRLILYVLMMTSLVGCGTKSENKDYSENRRDSQNQENGFVDYNDVFHSFKEVDQAKKDYLKQIKKGDFINAVLLQRF